MTDASDETSDLLQHRPLVTRPGKMIRAIELDELRPADGVRKVATRADGFDLVTRPMHDQRRNTDRREQGTNIHLLHDAFNRKLHIPARRATQEALEPIELRGVTRKGWTKQREIVLGKPPSPPTFAHLVKVLAPLVVRPLPGIVGGLHAERRSREQDQPCDTLGIGRREHRAQRAKI